ncbi:MAG: FAD-binding protein [Flavobacteriales bacterium]|nr:FAD-binding protein [Flavobacteriales bacterium]MCB9196378.1 FAD-binding protein [Flavobacteriales bacterium]MCB9198539.1 FAD-binding protein [Flavobacteriales bacterium]
MVQDLFKTVQISIAPHEAFDEVAIKRNLQLQFGLKGDFVFKVLKRSIDARRKPVKYALTIDLAQGEELVEDHLDIKFDQVPESADVIHIIGAGPAGLFAALEAIELGLKPVVYERGKDVKERRKDLAKITKDQKVDGESNYCFGEGGAGTYSDGKLYTRSKKKGSVRKVLEELVFFGADPDILVNTHPHIGTNKLPKIIENIRNLIIEKGGEVHFNSKLTDLSIQNGRLVSIEINGVQKVETSRLILATGHSARDIFYLLNERKVPLEFKPFALGVRVEHAQSLIDKIQYGTEERGEFLPPAAYSLVHNTKDRGVYSFCMCPGGIIAPCATDQEEVVTNGWSPSKRNNPYSNSGIVTEVRWEDITEFHQYGPLAGLEFQKSVEKACWNAAGKTQQVPAQRLKDFVENKVSKDLPKTSYFPGLVSVNLNEILPKFIAKNLREGFVNFGQKMKGYLTNDAVIHGTESRTSSPVRIPREFSTYEHPSVKGLYPCGEGAGYAGGIVSAAIDGQNIVAAIKELIN